MKTSAAKEGSKRAMHGAPRVQRDVKFDSRFARLQAKIKGLSAFVADLAPELNRVGHVPSVAGRDVPSDVNALLGAMSELASEIEAKREALTVRPSRSSDAQGAQMERLARLFVDRMIQRPDVALRTAEHLFRIAENPSPSIIARLDQRNSNLPTGQQVHGHKIKEMVGSFFSAVVVVASEATTPPLAPL